MIWGATISLLFWLHLDSQSFKIVRKFIYSILMSFKVVTKFHLPHHVLFSSSCWWWCKQTLKLLVILHLALFYYLSIITADQNMSFHGQVGRVIGQIVISHQVIQMMCAMFGDCHMFTKVLCSFCTEIDMDTLKYQAKYTRLQ